MASIKHTLDNNPINVCNMYKYLINLYKLDIIPIFKVEIKNKLNELVFIFEHATIIYNVNTKKWKIIINELNNTPVIESDNIDEILKITLESFNKNAIYNIHTVNNKKIHNLDQYHYYIFINNFIKNEKNFKFETYKKKSTYMPEELWCIINQYYKNSDIYYYDFLEQYL